MVDKGLIHDFDIFSNLLLVLFIISGVSYSIVSYKLLGQYKQLLGDNFSSTENINLNWLRGFIFTIATVFVLVALFTFLRDFMGLEFQFNTDIIIYSILTIAITLLGYFGIRHQNIFIDNLIVEVDKIGSEYKNSSLKEEFAIKKYKSLLKLMQEQKPYLEPKLTLNDLSNLLDTSPNHLSQIINQYEQQNFNDFVNKYRIEEFIERASQNKGFSFLAHALDSGFNSKTTFNTAFKKQKGVTPSQFLSQKK